MVGNISQIVIRVDSSPRIGGGHVMRCLTLANALTQSGAAVEFVCASTLDVLQARLKEAGHKVRRIEPPEGLQRERGDWHEPPLCADAQEEDAAATVKGIENQADWIIVDHYLLGERWQQAVRKATGRVLVVDDLANRRHDCDLLLDQTLGRSAADYRPLVPEQARVLAGTQFALLRPEFARERSVVLGTWQRQSRPSKIFLSLGTTDPGGITADVLRLVLAKIPKAAVDVVLGGQSPSVSVLRDLARERRNVRLHVDTNEIAALMRAADLAIGAAGTTSWERCCLGLPSIALVLAGNQEPSGRALSNAGAAIAVSHVEEIAPELELLLNSPERLESMSAAAFAITDGEGVHRVLQAMFGEKPLGCSKADIQLRPATRTDAEDIWLWRNDPSTRAASRSIDPVRWSDHLLWLDAVLKDGRKQLLIAENSSIPVGIVRFDALPDQDRAVEVSINVRPDLRGRGTGRAILEAACELIAQRQDACRIHASVHEDNSASLRLFENCGFARASSPGQDGFLEYQLAVDEQTTSAEG